MQIAIVTKSRVWGGLEAHAVSLAETLNAVGISTCIACIGDVTLDLYKNASCGVPLMKVTVPSSRGNVLGWFRSFRAVGADAAIFEKGTLYTGSVAMDLGLRLAFGSYLTIEQLEPPVLPERSSRRYLGGLVPGMGLWWYRWRLSGHLRSMFPGLTICISDAVRQRLVADYGFPRHRMVLIPHGVDVSEFRVDPARREAARRTWGVPDHAYVFGSARRLIRDKGLDVALEAFTKARRALPRQSLHLVIAGDGPERAALERQAAENGIAAYVHFLGFCHKPWELYPGFDAFLLPSRVEALGVVALEAMACGTELIASDVGGIPEMIPNDRVATLVPAGDAGAWAAAMVCAATRAREERDDRLELARAHVVKNYDRRVKYLQLLNVLLELKGFQARERLQCG